MAIHHHITDLIGRTPMLQLHRLAARAGAKGEILAKLEGFNPGGSAKDRVAAVMLRQAIDQGRLAPGGTVIEPTSGNTGVGLAMVCAAMDLTCVLVMPDSMSVERRSLLAAYGARVELTPGAMGMKGCIARAEQLRQEIPGSIMAGQFVNPANPAAHYASTGPEIWQDTEGQVDVFVAGIGTGGTITGVGRYLKEQNPAIRVVGIEPEASPLLTSGQAGPHPLQGIGANFVPEILDLSVVDEVMTVSGEDAYRTGRDLAQHEGLLAGITSGAVLWAALQLAQRDDFAGKRIVALLPDTGERYLSVPGYLVQ